MGHFDPFVDRGVNIDAGGDLKNDGDKEDFASLDNDIRNIKTEDNETKEQEDDERKGEHKDPTALAMGAFTKL